MQMYSTCQCDTFLVQRLLLWVGSDVSSFFDNKLFVSVSGLIALGEKKKKQRQKKKTTTKKTTTNIPTNKTENKQEKVFSPLFVSTVTERKRAGKFKKKGKYHTNNKTFSPFFLSCFFVFVLLLYPRKKTETFG